MHYGLRFKFAIAVVAVLICFAGARVTRAQEDEEKSIKYEGVIKDRPAGSQKARPPRKYKAASKTTTPVNTPPPLGSSYVQVGVTLWRLRPSQAGDKTKELVEVEEGRTEEATAERIDEGTPLAPGQRVRLSIESLNRKGFLYVIDREQYADGTLGDPMLIFPTRKTSDANYVQPSQLVYIPSAKGKFEIKPSEGPKLHVGEVVTILVSAKQLINPDQLGPKALKLTRQQVELWEKQWGAQATRFDLEGGAGQAMTQKEQAAGANNAPVLTQDDPGPQTVYRVAIKPENPVVVSVPLRFRR